MVNPTESQHIHAIREHAQWDAPYSITDAQLMAAHFSYKSFGVVSVMQLSDGVYTYGVAGCVLPTKRLRPKLVQLYGNSQSSIQ